MKKVVFMMVALLMTAGMAMAQGRGEKGGENADPKVRAERRTERMVKELSLNDTQKQQLLDLNLAEAQKLAECKAKPATPPAEGQQPAKMTQEEREQKRQAMEAQRAAYNEQLQKILTPEQYAKYTEKQKDCNKKGKDGKKKGKDAKCSGDKKQKKS